MVAGRRSSLFPCWLNYDEQGVVDMVEIECQQGQGLEVRKGRKR